MPEDFIRLNVHEISILISALQLLSKSEQNEISKEYGDVDSLYSKLSNIMDGFQTGTHYDPFQSS